ncbi:hypothetical protein SDC9_133741 [bioreactor metagenome]|uniref:Uncharacterized protein n=1 Tax=bioreactor metagenome TaxID=1076179 RepID=A0A645DBG2_9ZZZZ
MMVLTVTAISTWVNFSMPPGPSGISVRWRSSLPESGSMRATARPCAGFKPCRRQAKFGAGVRPSSISARTSPGGNGSPSVRRAARASSSATAKCSKPTADSTPPICATPRRPPPSSPPEQKRRSNRSSPSTDSVIWKFPGSPNSKLRPRCCTAISRPSAPSIATMSSSIVWCRMCNGASAAIFSISRPTAPNATNAAAGSAMRRFSFRPRFTTCTQRVSSANGSMMCSAAAIPRAVTPTSPPTTAIRRRQPISAFPAGPTPASSAPGGSIWFTATAGFLQPMPKRSTAGSTFRRSIRTMDCAATPVSATGSSLKPKPRKR